MKNISGVMLFSPYSKSRPIYPLRKCFLCANFLMLSSPQVFAIVGGTFTVAGIVDSLFFTASEVFKKFQLGKLT